MHTIYDMCDCSVFIPPSFSFFNSSFNNSHSYRATTHWKYSPSTWTWTVQSLQRILDILHNHARASLRNRGCSWQFWALQRSNIWANALFIELSHTGRVGLLWKLAVENNHPVGSVCGSVRVLVLATFWVPKHSFYKQSWYIFGMWGYFGCSSQAQDCLRVSWL